MNNKVQEDYLVYGMSCAACQATIQNKLNKTTGIEEVNINLLTKRMHLSFDETKINNDEIKQIVLDLGYKAVNLKESEQNYNEHEGYKKRLMISLIFCLPLSIIAMSAMFHFMPIVKFANYLSGSIFVLLQVLLLIPILILNKKYFINGINNLIKLHPNMDSLISLGSIAAMLYSLVNIILFYFGTVADKHNYFIHNLYFETAGMILTIVTIGKYFESKSKSKTNESIQQLVELMPLSCNKIVNNEIIVTDTNLIEVNDIVLVRAGEKIPVDGIIIDGHTTIDESIVTGEAVPVDKKVGDQVTISTLNKNGTIKVKVTNKAGSTWLDNIIKLVEEASSSSSKYLRLADRISLYFVPIVISIALITFICWLIFTHSIQNAFMSAVSVLVIACPCSLGLATPTSIMVGMGVSAKHGILFKNAETMEKLGNCKTFVFDKTGTITKGILEVKKFENKSSLSDLELLSIVASLEKNSNHPIAETICEYANKKNVTLYNVTNYTNEIGSGISGIINNTIYYIGNHDFIKSKINKEIDLNYGIYTNIYIANSSDVLGLISLSDIIKDTSLQAITLLKEKGIGTIICTGDSIEVANHVMTSVKANAVYSQMKPDDKMKVISDYQKHNLVCMIGDGINDSVALSKADVAMTVGAGTDIAKETSDVILVKNELLDVVNAYNISRAVSKNIKQNLFWALIYNVIAMLLSTGLYYVITNKPFNPMFAAAAMSLSSICVVTNALRLKKIKLINIEHIQEEQINMNKILIVEGMMCPNCERHVKNALETIDGVTANPNKDTKEVICTLTNNVNDDLLVSKVTEAGYKVLEVK